MTSIIKVNTFQDTNGNALFSSDGSGNVTLSSADLKGTPAFHVYPSSAPSPSNVTWTKVSLDTEVFDTDNAFDSTTNYRFTPQVAGKYYITWFTTDNYSSTAATSVQIGLYKNGSKIHEYQANGKGSAYGSYNLSAIVELNGSTDYVEFYVRNEGGSGVSWRGDSIRTYAQGYRIIGA